jgi:hypothetical protein
VVAPLLTLPICGYLVAKGRTGSKILSVAYGLRMNWDSAAKTAIAQL